MNIELRNLKINLTFSEETTMFKADVYVNGKKCAYAEIQSYKTQEQAYEAALLYTLQNLIK